MISPLFDPNKISPSFDDDEHPSWLANPSLVEIVKKPRKMVKTELKISSFYCGPVCASILMKFEWWLVVI